MNAMMPVITQQLTNMSLVMPCSLPSCSAARARWLAWWLVG
jgi:hypothetical protein